MCSFDDNVMFSDRGKRFRKDGFPGGRDPDNLECFADFSFIELPRAVDWMRNAAHRCVHDGGIRFSRSLAGFRFRRQE